MAISNASVWYTNPPIGSRSISNTIVALISAFLIWTFYLGAFFAIFAGFPWALLHSAGFRSWWIAPIAGFFVAFVIAFLWTIQGGQSIPELETSAWIQGKATMIDGRLTPYGESLYGPGAATRNGVKFGAFGALIALVLWRLAYRREKPINSLSNSTG